MARPHKYTWNHDIFKSWTPASAYLLGWVITDGSISSGEPRYSKGRSHPIVERSIRFELKEEDDIRVVARLLGDESAARIVHKKHGDYWRVHACSQEMWNDLMALGVTANKQFTTRFPDIPEEYWPDFMRGVLDGDGSIVTRPGGKYNRPGYVRLTVTIASASTDFMEDIFSSLGYGKVVPVHGKEGHRCGKVEFDCGDAVRFLHYIYDNSKEGLRLSRKWEKWQAFLKSGQVYGSKRRRRGS